MTRSRWKLTWDPAGTPIVLLDFDEMIADEPRWPMSRGTETVPLADSLVPFLRASGNHSVQIGFEVARTETLDATARQRVLESLIAAASMAKKPLRVEIQGISDRYWQFSQCLVTEHNPARHIPAPGSRHLRGWTLVCAGLAQVGP